MNDEKKAILLSVDLDGERAFLQKDKMRKDIFLQNGLPNALEFFNNLGIKPTFFVVGRNALDFPKEHRMLKKYDIGNHSFSHINFSSLNYVEKENEIKKGEDAIKKIIGKKPKVFRAPDYSIDESSISILKRRGYLADSSLLKVIFPFRYYKNYLLNKNLDRDKFEIPMTHTLLPFNGTSMINYGVDKSAIMLERISKNGRILNINFHDRDFTNEGIKSHLFLNREKSRETTEKIIEFMNERFRIISFDDFLSLKQRL
ncbi:MAG: polysaccharide deacetylase family protein [Candidatus Woesearchaeota archaeon]|nr:polysaccharide deacetylase family protein [Candidatus Woesearchaeota archaeon]